MIYLNEQEIFHLADPIELTDQMEEALRVYMSGNYVMPDRLHMDMDDNTLLLMPAGMDTHMGTKLISLCPGNTQKNLPVITGLMLLNDAMTGEPLAMLNGAKLTAVRTAAVSAMGIRLLTPDRVDRLGLIGAGVQGLHQVLFASSVRPLKEIVVYDLHPERLAGWTEQLSAWIPDTTIQIVSDPRQLVESSQIIITATHAERPVMPDDPELLRGKSFVAIGSYKPYMRELPDSLFRLINTCWVDTEKALEEAGDLIQPIQDGLLRKDQVIPLGDLLLGKSIQDHHDTILYKTVGMALFDLLTARYLYQKACQLNCGQLLVD